jgi:alpha-glucosidase (family GH31 glycosyl hydrolase)
MVEILHAPFGQEHPYEQLPEERFPRQPLACQPFTIGAVTRPPGAAREVRVHQILDGKALPPVPATLIPDWQPQQEEGVGAEFLERIVRIEQDVWQANLTAPPFGGTLAYWLEANGARTKDFTLRGEDWRSAGGCVMDGLTMKVSPALSGNGQVAGLPNLLEIAWLTDGQRARRVRLTFACEPDIAFYGLGERFNALDQRGNILDVRCYEQYKKQGKRTYMPIPFLLSSAGYGVYVRSSRWMQFDLSDSDRWVVEADLGADESLELQWFNGADPLDITGQFARVTGPAALPPLWAFGLWMSANEWNNQARVMQEVEQSLAYDIVPSVVVIEAWSDETTFYIWNDAQYTPKPGAEAHHYADFTFAPEGKWPDPKGMVDWLHERGLKLLLWQIPALKVLEGQHPQHEADRAYFEQSGFGVREPDGTPYKIRPFWFRGGYLWDVTNPAEREWWLNKRAYLLDEVGIDGFKTDGGEHLWSTQVQFADGRRGDELWNEYPQRYVEAYYQFANRKREAITFSRAGFTGSQRSPLHWAGDENSTWEAFRHSILAGLSAGISGIPFWGWDLGGFSGDIPTVELYLRGAAMAAFCPVMQYHSEYNPQRQVKRDRTPWNIQERTGDERVIPTFRRFVNVRHNLMPYIWQEAQHSAQTGEPMMRALKLYDRNASDYQYYFGRDLLVCPVVEPGVERWPVYLPEGVWYDLWTSARYEGGQTYSVNVPLGTIPVFARAGAQVPVRFGAGHTLGEPVELNGESNAVLVFPAEK